MKHLTSEYLRKAYLDFFREKGHAVIPSASLIPDNDPTVLFTTAGMHPLVPYLSGQKHPSGKRLTDVQKCVRTGDIDEVGDASHCTFFEMLGNWSLGDYFKNESISYSYEFLTNVLEIPPTRLAVSVFAGDEDAPRDETAAEKWIELGIPKDHVFYLPKKNNWWGPAGQTGPCGPDTEIFFITEKEPCGEHCDPSCDCGRYLEIWNNVFMEFDKQPDGTFRPLSQKNVDTGMGLERTILVLGGYNSVYETDVFRPVMEFLKEKTGLSIEGANEKAMRVIADHIRTAAFLLGDEKGVTPSNVDQGYILRRLIRRAVRFARQIGLDNRHLVDIAKAYVDSYRNVYPELGQNETRIVTELEKEVEKFNVTLNQGLKEFEKLLKYIQNNRISGKAAFKLYDTFGFPIEMTVELANEHGITVDEAGFEQCFKEHQQKSQAGAEQKFKGGLLDHGEQTTKLHTATHLLLAALKYVFQDPNIQQKGSNITAERLRFDFNFPRALTAEELSAVENRVNDCIRSAIPVVCEEMSLEEAKASGATGVFESKYLDTVKVYTVGDVSKEICGGPHAANTADLEGFRIVKEQSSSSGVRRIKAVIGKRP